MGEVYRARDTTLGREVALKFLPEAVARDPDRRMRFEREARALAALNHPHIATIHGVEKIDGVTAALVMELVDGEDLSDRLAHGALPFDETIAIARQMAQALEAAHTAGIIHRDLKPGNVKVRSDGTVKVLDFGLARALDPMMSSSTGSPATSPTVTSPAMTAAGMILGTAAYMSPEQAKGRPVDRRADIWAFGCVLYEMLTGRRAFAGDDVTDTLAAILRAEPDWTALPRDLPPNLRRLLLRCLQKDPARRLRDMGDVQLELADDAEIATPAASATSVPVRRAAWRERLIWLSAVALASVATGLGVWALRPAPPEFETKLDLVTPRLDNFGFSFALSPNGRYLAFAAEDAGQRMIWLRPLDQTTARPLDGTRGGRNPFWSPDSRSIGFIADGRLKRLDLSGGAPRDLGAGNSDSGASWGPEGILLGTNKGVMRIAESGGERVPVTTLADGATGHHQPQFLPDGRRFLFFANGPENVRGVYLAALDDPQGIRLTGADAVGSYLAPGWLLYVQGGSLLARRIDLDRRALVGDVVPVADQISFSDANRRASYAVAHNGTIAYRAGTDRSQLTWFDRTGAVRGTLGEAGLIFSPRLSPDGRRAAVTQSAQGTWDVWIVDAVRSTRFTFGTTGTRSYLAVWSPANDGLIAYSRAIDGKPGGTQMVKPSAGGGTETQLAELGRPGLTDWSRDGRFILVDKSPQDLWVIPADGKNPPFPFIDKTPFEERLARFSPDGRWVAYQSNETGRAEIYVRPFPAAAGQVKISNAGGAQPRWGNRGDEIFWIAPDATLMAARVVIKGTSFEPDVPVALFQTRIQFGGSESPFGGEYDVAPDGRFLINTVVEDQSAPAITIVQHWRGLSER
jgi:serine/threonine protein kinase/Tol biopolymer transport system component